MATPTEMLYILETLAFPFELTSAQERAFDW